MLVIALCHDRTDVQFWVRHGCLVGLVSGK